jgi:TonB-dependent SusC/RagA subfamily outer membrane receptor
MINKLFLCVSFLLLASSMLVAQKTVKGTISDTSGLLPGVSILEKGTNNGVQTDFEGNFSIDVSSNDAVLSISYLGFKTQEVSVVGKKILNIFLQEDAESLAEIVVTAQGIKKSKKALGYAITKLDAEEVSKRPEADLARTLQGKISGVIIGTADGQTGSSSPIRIRGSISLTGDNNPLIVVNNVPFNGLLRDIDPNDIQDMSVLKGFNAAVLYGSAGRNGVILIQTKSGNGKIG